MVTGCTALSECKETTNQLNAIARHLLNAAQCRTCDILFCIRLCLSKSLNQSLSIYPPRCANAGKSLASRWKFAGKSLANHWKVALKPLASSAE